MTEVLSPLLQTTFLLNCLREDRTSTHLDETSGMRFTLKTRQVHQAMTLLIVSPLTMSIRTQPPFSTLGLVNRI